MQIKKINLVNNWSITWKLNSLKNWPMLLWRSPLIQQNEQNFQELDETKLNFMNFIISTRKSPWDVNNFQFAYRTENQHSSGVKSDEEGPGFWISIWMDFLKKLLIYILLIALTDYRTTGKVSKIPHPPPLATPMTQMNISD